MPQPHFPWLRPRIQVRWAIIADTIAVLVRTAGCGFGAPDSSAVGRITGLERRVQHCGHTHHEGGGLKSKPFAASFLVRFGMQYFALFPSKYAR